MYFEVDSFAGSGCCTSVSACVTPARHRARDDKVRPLMAWTSPQRPATTVICDRSPTDVRQTKVPIAWRNQVLAKRQNSEVLVSGDLGSMLGYAQEQAEGAAAAAARAAAVAAEAAVSCGRSKPGFSLSARVPCSKTISLPTSPVVSRPGSPRSKRGDVASLVVQRDVSPPPLPLYDSCPRIHDKKTNMRSGLSIETRASDEQHGTAHGETSQARLQDNSSALRGLSYKVQSHSRRADLADVRLAELRRELRDELHVKIADLEVQLKATSSTCQSLLMSRDELEQRVGAIEDAQNAAQGVAHDESGNDTEAHVLQIDLSKRFEDISQKVERLSSESQGDHGWRSKLEEHEVRLSSLRSKLDTLEMHKGGVEERMHKDLDTQAEQIRKFMHEAVNQRLESHERIEELARRADGLGSSLAELFDRHLDLARSVRVHDREGPVEVHNSQPDRSVEFKTVVSRVEELSNEVKMLAARVDVKGPKTEASKDVRSCGSDVVARVAALEITCGFLREELDSLRRLQALSARSPRTL